MRTWIGRLGASVLLFSGGIDASAQPLISLQPRAQAVAFNHTTTLWVEARGTEPVRYQWFFNSVTNPLPSATNEFLVISRASEIDAGEYWVRVEDADGIAWSDPATLALFSRGLAPFGTVDLTPTFQLDGVGNDVDSIAFWESPDATNTLLLVTAKANDVVEVWHYPFVGNERPAWTAPTNINGMVVDPATDRLYVSDRTVTLLSLPDLQTLDHFGQGIIGVGENNLDLLRTPDGGTVVYVSDDHNIHRFAAGSWDYLGSFAPPVSSIETVLADDYYQLILVPEEQGPVGNPGVYAYHPDGTPFLKRGTNRFGNHGEFDSDEEGILLYTFPSDGSRDNGAGFYVVSDQRMDQTDFEFFDRETWEHLGTLRLAGVSNTDGIASTQRALPEYPLGLFAAINNDTTTAGLSWEVFFQALGVSAAPRVIGISPAGSGPADPHTVEFAVEFSRPVRGFEDGSDLLITHRGTSHSGVSITGQDHLYHVRVTGLEGEGWFVVAVNTANDVVDLEGSALVSSVTSVPVNIPTPYGRWARSRRLESGVNDGFWDDPDSDERPNIEEFATDTDPLRGVHEDKQDLLVTESGEATELTYTMAVRDGATFTGDSELFASIDGVFYSIAGSADLLSFDEPVLERVPATADHLPAPNSGWSYRSFRLTQPEPANRAGGIRVLIGAAP